MPDRWFYLEAGSPQGPLSVEELQQRAAAGKLTAIDLIWPEGGDPLQAVQAQSVLPRKAFRPGSDKKGKWAGKVAEVLTTMPAEPAATPDWLSDVEQAPASPMPPPLPPRESKKRRHGAAGKRPAVPLAAPVVALSNKMVEVPYAPRLVLCGASSKGNICDRNDDRFQVWHWQANDAEGSHEVALLVVADGVSGFDGSDEASNLTVHTVANHFTPQRLAGQQRDGSVIGDAIEQAFREANRVVLEQGKANPYWEGLSAMAAIVLIWDGQAYFGHVGDCRVYLHRGSELKQLTEDQTIAARMLPLGKDAGKVAASQEASLAVGARPTIKPTRAEQELLRGDYLVVASTGLAADVEVSAIEQTLNCQTVPAQHLANHLVHLADECGGTDNCTVVVAHFS